jgi:hypothetical protein
LFSFITYNFYIYYLTVIIFAKFFYKTPFNLKLSQE